MFNGKSQRANKKINTKKKDNKMDIQVIFKVQYCQSINIDDEVWNSSDDKYALISSIISEKEAEAQDQEIENAEDENGLEIKM